MCGMGEEGCSLGRWVLGRQIPVLEMAEGVLFESSAIMRYGGPRVPKLRETLNSKREWILKSGFLRQRFCHNDNRIEQSHGNRAAPSLPILIGLIMPPGGGVWGLGFSGLPKRGAPLPHRSGPRAGSEGRWTHRGGG